MNDRAMRIRNLLAAAVLGAAITTPASAQLGGLVRKAKEAAAQKAVESAIGPTNKSLKASDAFGPELTAASLDGVLRGLGVRTPLARPRPDAAVRAGGDRGGSPGHRGEADQEPGAGTAALALAARGVRTARTRTARLATGTRRALGTVGARAGRLGHAGLGPDLAGFTGL